jgi:hypothetical protein
MSCSIDSDWPPTRPFANTRASQIVRLSLGQLALTRSI